MSDIKILWIFEAQLSFFSVIFGVTNYMVLHAFVIEEESVFPAAVS